MATDPWGIDDGYFDVRGEWHPTSPETRTALREAMTGDADRPPEPSRPLWVVRAGAAQVSAVPGAAMGGEPGLSWICSVASSGPLFHWWMRLTG